MSAPVYCCQDQFGGIVFIFTLGLFWTINLNKMYPDASTTYKYSMAQQLERLTRTLKVTGSTMDSAHPIQTCHCGCDDTDFRHLIPTQTAYTVQRTGIALCTLTPTLTSYPDQRCVRTVSNSNRHIPIGVSSNPTPTRTCTVHVGLEPTPPIHRELNPHRPPTRHRILYTDLTTQSDSIVRCGLNGTVKYKLYYTVYINNAYPYSFLTCMEKC